MERCRKPEWNDPGEPKRRLRKLGTSPRGMAPWAMKREALGWGGSWAFVVGLVLILLTATLEGQPACETPAIARDDTALVTAGETVVIDLFANDSDADGEPLTLSGALGSTDCGSLGSAAYNADGTVTFNAFGGAGGACNLTYTLTGGGSASVAVTVAESTVDTDGCDGIGDTNQDPFGYSDELPTEACINGSGAAEECCWPQIIRGLRGQAVCTEVTENWAAEPADLFGGGSENHSHLCQTAQYLQTGESGWYLNYINAQLGFNPSQDLYGWMGTEVLSPIYGPWIVTSNMAALHKARQGSTEPDQALASKLEDWLLKYWVMQALLASDFPIAESTFRYQGADSTVSPPAGFWDGLSVGAAGSRRVKHDLVDDDGDSATPGIPRVAFTGFNQPAHFLTALALDFHPRNLGSTHLALNDRGLAERYYIGLRVALLLSGEDFFPQQSGVVDFETFEPPASHFGLTEAQRETLRLFVESRGTQDPSVVLDLLSTDPIPHCSSGTGNRCCEMTFLRTTEGTMGYFGAGEHGLQTSINPGEGRQYICNRNRPPMHAIRTDLDGSVTILSPGEHNTRRNDNTFETPTQVCAEYALENQGIHQKCIDKPGGDVIYEITWTTAEGLVVRDYSPQGGLPEAPDISAQPMSLTVAEGAPASFQVTAQSVPPGRALDYRWYKDGAPLPLSDPGFIGVEANTLQIPAALPGDSGNYHCRVSDRAEPTLFDNSEAAALTVNAGRTGPRHRPTARQTRGQRRRDGDVLYHGPRTLGTGWLALPVAAERSGSRRVRHR